MVTLTIDGQVVRVPEGTTIPIEKTSPAVDLTALFNGFRPLFTTLQPEAIAEMESGEYPLTLFTCTTNRTNRITIRCDKVTE